MNPTSICHRLPRHRKWQFHSPNCLGSKLCTHIWFFFIPSHRTSHQSLHQSCPAPLAKYAPDKSSHSIPATATGPERTVTVTSWPSRLMLLSPHFSPLSAQQPGWSWQEAKGSGAFFCTGPSRALPPAELRLRPCQGCQVLSRVLLAAGLPCVPSLSPHGLPLTPSVRTESPCSLQGSHLCGSPSRHYHAFLTDTCYQWSLHSSFSFWWLPTFPLELRTQRQVLCSFQLVPRPALGAAASDAHWGALSRGPMRAGLRAAPQLSENSLEACSWLMMLLRQWQVRDAVLPWQELPGTCQVPGPGQGQGRCMWETRTTQMSLGSRPQPRGRFWANLGLRLLLSCLVSLPFLLEILSSDCLPDDTRSITLHAPLKPAQEGPFFFLGK